MRKLLYIFILIGLDQLTKYVFYDLGWLQETWLMTPLINTGIAWSLPVPPWIVMIVSIVVVIILVRTLALKKNEDYVLFSLLIIAGAVGNLIDRFVYGGVRDFVDLQVWPVFNMADVYLTLAVLVMVYYEWSLWRAGRSA